LAYSSSIAVNAGGEEMSHTIKKQPSVLSDKSVQQVEELYTKVVFRIDAARSVVQRTVNTEMVTAYWLIGRDIVEVEQKGQERAEYGSFIVKQLSLRLNKRFKRGFSVTTLKQIRLFFTIYQQDTVLGKGHALRDLSAPGFPASLSWTHYRVLLKISKDMSTSHLRPTLYARGLSS
jgi:hypothetical protein